MDSERARRIVREGYDRLAAAYVAQRGQHDTSAWLDKLTAVLPPGGRVLDLGCGAGVPIARTLSERGLAVTGVDIAAGPLALARRSVPEATFLQADMATVEFADASFDGVCALYAIIHVPREEHAALFRKIARWLRPHGHALLVLGATAWEGVEPYLDGVPMFWSHFDARTNAALLEAAGLRVVDSGLVPDPPGAHWFVLAVR